MKKISIVIPTLNEEGNIIPITSAIIDIMQKHIDKYDYEIIVIDNHSTDQTKYLIRQLCNENNRIKAIFNSKNFGAKSSVYGLTQADGDCVIKISADFQDPVELIDDFIREWENGYKIVIGIKEKSQENKFIHFIRTFYYRLIKKIAEIEHIDNFSGYGLYDKAFIGIIRDLNDSMPYFRGIVAELGFEYKKIFYQQPNRRAGKSKYNFYKLFDYAMLGITSYSKVFIRIATMLGGVISVGSLLIGLVYFILKLVHWNRFDAGFAPMIIGMFFLGAVQLLFLGILGEYILSINTRVLNRPLVIEEERVNFLKIDTRSSSDLSEENNMKKLILKYKNGEISKHEFVDEMYKTHAVLELYQEILRERNISSISIDANQIIFTLKNTEEIKIIHSRNDKYGIPLQIINFGGYEEDVFNVMTELINEGDTVFDIGANVGWYGIRLDKYYKSINLFSFEPLPNNYLKLIDNFRLNDLDTLNAYNLGFFNKKTNLVFYFDLENNKASFLTNLRGTSLVEEITCRVSRLDDFVRENDVTGIDFIKCDVEGSELFVFQGALETITRFRPIILTEMLRKWAAKFNYHPNDIISFFKNIDYQCFELINGRLNKITEVTDCTISTNYVFLTEEHLQKEFLLNNQRLFKIE